MIEVETAPVNIETVPAKKKKSKAKKKGKAGRPTVYNREVILQELSKYAGQRGGAKAAHAALLKRKGFKDKDGKGISYPLVVNIAKKAGIVFGMGRPVEKPKPAKIAVAA